MFPKLGMHHLALLLGLAETGNVSAAAARLGITQSAASHRIREAERRIGVTLTRRVSGGMVLTPEGERIRILADRLLRELVRLETELEDQQGDGRALARLGQATYSRYHWLPAFQRFLEAHDPGLTIDLSGQATARPLASLTAGIVDLSTIYGRPTGAAHLRWDKLATDPLVMVMSPDHELAALPYVASSDVAPYRVFTYPFATEPGFEWETLIGRPTVPYTRITAMPTPEAVIDLLRAGYGVSLFSQWAVGPELADGSLVARPLSEEGMSLDWFAVTRAEDGPDTPAGRLLDATLAWAREAQGAGLATLAFPGMPDASPYPGSSVGLDPDPGAR